MDLWVRSEFAGELAVVSAWIAALLPWSVGYGSVFDGALFDVRFPFVRIRYTRGVPLTEAVEFADPLSAMAMNRGTTAILAYRGWVAAAAVLTLAVGLSIVYYAREERVEAATVDPVRVMGGLLLVAGIVFGVDTYLFATTVPGLTLPVGVAVIPILGLVLLRVDRAETGSTDDVDGDDVDSDDENDVDGAADASGG